MKQVLMCKGCENLRTSSTYPSGRWCKVDGHLKGFQKDGQIYIDTMNFKPNMDLVKLINSEGKCFH